MNSTDFYDFQRGFQTGCNRCTLSHQTKVPIVWRGNPKAKILLIGEAPGKIEEEKMLPFVGPAGQLLEKMLNAVGLESEKDMLIMNTVYCRPTAPQYSGRQNYTPKTDQIASCWPFTEKAIKILQKPVIIACGRTALCELIADDKARLGDYEGKWMEHDSGAYLFCMRHPAAILHQHDKLDPDSFKELKQKVKDYMDMFKDTWQKKVDEYYDN